VADGTCSGCTIRTTTVSYSTGAKLIVTEWIDNKGNVKKVTTVLIPPPPGGGGGGGGSGAGTGQGGSSPNTVTGYQQTRNVGKLGRITWHEMYRQ